jgi:hypothetical protein
MKHVEVCKSVLFGYALLMQSYGSVCGADIQFPPVPQNVPRQNMFAWYRPIPFKSRWEYVAAEPPNDDGIIPRAEAAGASTSANGIWANELVWLF